MYLIESLQTLQNKAARAVTKLDWTTPTSELLKQCSWLSVHQLSVYHTVILAFNVMQARSPKYLYNMFNNTYSYKTREAASGKIRNTRNPDLELSQDSFRCRAVELYNQLPASVKSHQNLQGFKTAVKQWVKQNVELS